MVSKRKLKCGIISYDSPEVPRARRSVRKRSFCKETFDDGQLCAFELLAAVAGKLLQESDSSSASSNAAAVVGNHNISEELFKEGPQHHVNEAIRTEQEDQGSSEESGVCSSLCLWKCTKKDSHKEAVQDASNEAMIKQISADSDYSCSAKTGFEVKPITIHRSENGFNKLCSKSDGDSPKCGESVGPNVDSGTDRVGPCQDVNKGTCEVLAIDEKFSSKDGVELGRKLSPPIHTGRGSTHDASFSKRRNDVKVDGRDDDGNISQLSDPCSQEKAYGSPIHVVDRPIKKLLTSKKRNAAPKLKDSTGSKMNNFIFSNGKSCCAHERFQHNTPLKKRKLFGQSTGITLDGSSTGGTVSNSDGNIISSSSMDCQQSFDSANSHVKLSIKSFIVPELLIEVAENTTVASLKKTVMDAVTTALGGGLHVGVLLHGKKICDDNRTLLQTGISENDNVDDLGFVLEPCITTQLPPNSPHDDPLSLPTCLSPKDYVNRTLNSTQESPLIDIPDNTSVTESGDSGRIYQDLVLFSAPELVNKPLSDSKALVPVPENAEALAVVPMSPKLRRSEIGQRRIRRPFTVSEVEALVQAVETLGTGRWRDVKLGAFGSAKHRTYVDLKDKWKTLVHTARISPQQRRGEPVPQELLDRVLAAHSYWSQHQTRQQGKHQQLQLNQPGMLKVSATPAEKVAA